MPSNPVPWMIPQYLVDALGDGPLPEITPTNRTYREGWDGPILPGQVIQYASLRKAITDMDDSGLLEPGSFIMYDLEGWAASPQADRDAPYAALRTFGNACAARGFGSIAVPGKLVSAERAAALTNSDVFVAQFQAEVVPNVFKAHCKKIRKALGPDKVFIAEISAGRAKSVKVLQNQWLAAKPLCDGFALWYGAPTDGTPGVAPGVGNFEQQALRATAFLRWVYDQSN